MFFTEKPEFNSEERKIANNIKKELKGYSLTDTEKLLRKIVLEKYHEIII